MGLFDFAKGTVQTVGKTITHNVVIPAGDVIGSTISKVSGGKIKYKKGEKDFFEKSKAGRAYETALGVVGTALLAPLAIKVVKAKPVASLVTAGVVSSSPTVQQAIIDNPYNFTPMKAGEVLGGLVETAKPTKVESGADVVKNIIKGGAIVGAGALGGAMLIPPIKEKIPFMGSDSQTKSFSSTPEVVTTMPSATPGQMTTTKKRRRSKKQVPTVNVRVSQRVNVRQSQSKRYLNVKHIRR